MDAVAFEFETNSFHDNFSGFFNLATILFLVVAFLIIVTFVVLVVVAVRKSKTRTMIKKSFEVAENHLDSVFQKQRMGNEAHVCDYCGTLIPAGKSECSSCGAKKSTKKTR